jgi:hypothetical protein
MRVLHVVKTSDGAWWAAMDTLACTTGLEYAVLKQRARPTKEDERQRWQAVWDEARHTAAAFGRHNS